MRNNKRKYPEVYDVANKLGRRFAHQLVHITFSVKKGIVTGNCKNCKCDLVLRVDNLRNENEKYFGFLDNRLIRFTKGNQYNYTFDDGKIRRYDHELICKKFVTML